MKVVGILGSPRRDGNTEILLDRALAGAASAGAETEKVLLSDSVISGCIECNDCFETGACSIDDDMDRIYQELERADRIIIASPMFFMGLTSLIKAVIDRCQCYWALQHVLKEEFPRPEGSPHRYGLFIGTGGTKGLKLFDGTILTLKYFFEALAVTPREELYVLVRGVDDKGEVLSRDDALSSAFDSGKKLSELK